MPVSQPALPAIPTYDCELDVADGLEGIAWRELKTRFDDRIEKSDMPNRSGTVRFSYVGNPYQLLRLQIPLAAYFVRHYPVPRPKALLGDQHFKGILAQIATARELAPAESWRTMYISAAGSDSAVMTRLRDELATKTGLIPSDEEGDLLIRLRRPSDGSEGWEVLVRLTPRPLATRAWRVCNREGALNASVAHAMALFTRPTADDVFVNLMCGSGTLLIERLAAGPVAQVIGYDHDPMALECARRNAEAAGYAEQIKLREGDARGDLTMTARSADVIVADLPFGNLVGSHEDNLDIYPLVFKEAARIAKPGARVAFISHEIRLMESLLEQSTVWKQEQVIRITLGGLHPRIYLLMRI